MEEFTTDKKQILYEKIKNIHATDNTAQVFDNSFRTISVRIPKWLIPLVNEVCKTDFTMEDQIELAYGEETALFNNSFRILRRSTDLKMQVNERRYHIECESNVKTGVAIRMFEYDWMDAVNHVQEDEDGIYWVSLQNSGLVFLRSTKNTPRKFRYRLLLPGEKVAEYEIPILHNFDYTLEMIFEKQLYILLPFYLLRYEEEYKMIRETREKLKEMIERDCSAESDIKQEGLDENNAEYMLLQEKLANLDRKEESLANMLATDLESIYNELNQRVQQGKVVDYEVTMLSQLMHNVGSHVFREESLVRERMMRTMGGKVLEFDWDIEYRKQMQEERMEGRLEGRVEGRIEGHLQGENHKLVALVCRKLRKGKSPELIAEELEEELEVIEQICNIAEAYEPEYDVEAICTRMELMVV